MTGTEIYKRAMLMLGYNDCDGNIAEEQAHASRAVDVINQIGLDLCCMPPITTLSDEIQVSERVEEAMPYGVGMLLALSENDGAKNTLFCELYNLKRAAARRCVHTVRDTLPVSGG